MSSLFLFQLSSVCALVVFIWFNTDFLAHYVKLLKKILPKKIYDFFLIEDWFKGNSFGITEYPEFLYVKHINSKSALLQFLLKLASCKICFSFWVSMVSSLLFLNFWYLGILFIITISLEFAINFILIKVNKYLQ
jgi:hypothetical protein